MSQPPPPSEAEFHKPQASQNRFFSDDRQQKLPRSFVWMVLFSTTLGTMGQCLIGGGFLTYLAAEAGVKDRLMAVVLALPELMGGLAFLARPVELRLGNRKWAWILNSLLARGFAIGIPVAIWQYGRGEDHRLTVVILVCLGISSVWQSMATVQWYAWMSEIFPRPAWGRFLAWRNIASLLVLLTVPVGAGMVRDLWKTSIKRGELEAATLTQFYLGVFVIGNVLILCSLLPLLRLPGTRLGADQPRESSQTVFREILRDRDYRSLIAFLWWHAFWSGLTQAAFFDYRYHTLHIGLGTYYLLEGVMRLVQIPVNQWSGVQCDLGHTRRVLSLGVVLLSLSLVFWMLASPAEWWWLWGAYLLWSAWGTINVAGPTLALRMAPRQDNTLHLAIAERGSGMAAGIAGLLGGILLAEWLAMAKTRGLPDQIPYQWIFALGMGGRLASLFWLYRIPLSRERDGENPG